MSLGPFIPVATYLRRVLSISHEHTRINGQFVHCRTLVATNVRTGVSSAKISLDLTKIDHLCECARASWTRRDFFYFVSHFLKNPYQIRSIFTN